MLVLDENLPASQQRLLRRCDMVSKASTPHAWVQAVGSLR